MREVRGLQGRDFVTDRKIGMRARAKDISKITVNKHQSDAETAKAELAAVKAKLGLLGLDINNLPDALPGAVVQPVGDGGAAAIDDKKPAKDDKKASK